MSKDRKFYIFEGTKKGFTEYVNRYVTNFDKLDIKVSEHDSSQKFGTEFEKSSELAVSFDDYFSITPEANKRLVSLVELITVNNAKIFIHNPTKRVLNDLENSEYHVEKENMDLAKFDEKKLINLYEEESKIWKRELIKTILHNEFGEPSQKPMVIMISGKPGLGKTEVLKNLSEHLNTDLMRIQLSNYHNLDNLDLLFGKNFPSLDLYSQIRLSNNPIIFLDEVDKVHSLAYNSFFQLFDEDIVSNGEVELNVSNRYFIMTSNFQDESEIHNKMPAAIVSRIDKFIQVESLNQMDIDNYLNNIHEEIAFNVKKRLSNMKLNNIDYRLINKLILEEKEEQFMKNLLKT